MNKLYCLFSFFFIFVFLSCSIHTKKNRKTVITDTIISLVTKKEVLEPNLEIVKNKAKIVDYKGTQYIVTSKNTIISLNSNKKMNWGEENGDRKNILALASPKNTEQIVTDKVNEELFEEKETYKEIINNILGQK